MISIRTKSNYELVPAVFVTESIVGDGESLGDETIFNGVFSQETATTNRFLVQSSRPDEVLTFTNLTPEISSVANWPFVDWASNGQGRLKITGNDGSTVLILGFIDSADYAYTPTAFVADSVGDFTWSILQPMLDASADNEIFTGLNYNASCWAAAFDFSGIALGGTGGALITPQHLLGVWHFTRSIGSIVEFRSKSSPGLTISRAIVGITQDYGPKPYDDPFSPNRAIADFIIYALNSPVPSSIEWYEVVGDWCHTEGATVTGPPPESLTTTERAYHFTGISVEQNRRAYLNAENQSRLTLRPVVSSTDLYGTTVPAHVKDRPVNGIPFTTGMFQPYANRVHYGIAGDSGCPTFVPTSSNTLALWLLYSSASNGMDLNPQVLNLCILSANDHAVSLGHTRPTDYTVTVAPDPTL